MCGYWTSKVRRRSSGWIVRQCISTQGGMASHCDADRVVTNNSAHALRNVTPAPLTKYPLLQARWPVTMPPPVGLGVAGDTEESSSHTMCKRRRRCGLHPSPLSLGAEIVTEAEIIEMALYLEGRHATQCYRRHLACGQPLSRASLQDKVQS